MSYKEIPCPDKMAWMYPLTTHNWLTPSVEWDRGCPERGVIGYTAGDPVEHWLYNVLCLDSMFVWVALHVYYKNFVATEVPFSVNIHFQTCSFLEVGNRLHHCIVLYEPLCIATRLTASMYLQPTCSQCIVLQ